MGISAAGSGQLINANIDVILARFLRPDLQQFGFVFVEIASNCFGVEFC
jgi:hypothetical protein